MNELTTAIKFVGAGNGGGSGATDAANSSASTGDITMLVAGIVALLIGAVAIWATIAYRKRALEGAHVAGSNATFIPLIAAAIAIVLGLGLTLASTSSIKAHAEGAITTDTCIGTVDEQAGSITFSNITMKNESDAPQVLNSFELVAADGVTTLNDVVWTFNVEGESEPFFNGKFGSDPEEDWFPLTMPKNSSYTLTVSATGILPEVAKSLINKDVAYAVSYYDVESFAVSASVQPEEGGKISYNPGSLLECLYVPYGTAYTVSDNTITFGEGDDEQTITFIPETGYKLTNWTLNGTDIKRGTVISDMAFVAKSELDVPHYSGTVKLWGVDTTSSTASPIYKAKVKFNDGAAVTDRAETDSSGNFTLKNTSETTPGEITIEYPETLINDDAYSVVKKEVSGEAGGGALGDFEIRKLSSLYVSVYRANEGEATEGNFYDKYWCPSFSDGGLTKTSIKFYDSDKCEIDGSANESTEDYKMDDLYDSENIKSKAQFYAFVSSGVTLNCYQMADVYWNYTFKFNSKGTVYPQPADSLVETWNKDGKCCKDTNAATVYFNSSDSSSWTTTVGTAPTGVPTLNSVSYNNWVAAYGGGKGGVLSRYATQPLTPVASSDTVVYFYYSTTSQWLPYWNTYDPCSIVLHKTYTS